MAKYNEQPDPNKVNLLAEGTEVTGDINAKTDIRIDGFLKGNIYTSGKVVVGKSGKTEGEIHCATAEISGSINGKINVKELLTLQSTSVIQGDIIANQLAIEAGAKFTGNCNMSKQNETGISGKSSKKEEKGTQ